MQQLSVGLSLHRPEMLPLICASMRRHDAIFLEEAVTPGFERMLRGELPVEAYLLPTDMEYPAFSRAMCLRLQALHAEGNAVFQVEPFIEILLSEYGS